MKQTINFCQFTDAFRDMNRADNFSYNGLKALYEYIERMDDECETDTELDVIALCCEFTEYENLAEFQENYGVQAYPSIEAVLDDTMCIPIDDESFIIQDF